MISDETDMRKAGRKGWMMKAWESEWSGVEDDGMGGWESGWESQGVEDRECRLTEDY